MAPNLGMASLRAINSLCMFAVNKLTAVDITMIHPNGQADAPDTGQYELSIPLKKWNQSLL
jgi:hypothetical protein